jgi:hypothetical protein
MVDVSHQPTNQGETMVQAHPSTPAERVPIVAHLLAHAGEYGVVTAMSRTLGVSRQTLSTWCTRAHQAVLHAFTPPAPTPARTPALERHVLTVLVAGHASIRGIQACLRTLTQQGLSLDTITAILADAQQRALHWMATHVPATPRALALDEIFGNARHGAYLNAVDVVSGAVWATTGPVAADSESWTLVLWDLQARGLRWNRVVTDGGHAMQAACTTVTPYLPLQRDLWHVLHRCAQTQGRLDQRVRDQVARTAGIERQAARLAAGKPLQGRRVGGQAGPADPAAHAAQVAGAQALAESVRFLTQEMRRLLEVVVLDHRGILTPAQRQADLETALELLAEVARGAPTVQQTDLLRLHTYLAGALPDLVHFVVPLTQVQDGLLGVLPAERQGLLAWAWLRRKALGWTGRTLLLQVPEAWRDAGRLLLAAWADAVRVSSAVERWHSILRPHLAVHRTLSPGMVALLAVWHNHRVFRRGVHRGQSPLHLSGMTDGPADWLVALGYPPDAPSVAANRSANPATMQRQAA